MADDVLQRLGAAAVLKAPVPLQRAARGVVFRAENGPTQSIASGSQSGNLAGVIPGQNVINVMDPQAFQGNADQLTTHELTHRWQDNLPPTLAAKIPADNAADPYNFGGLARLTQLRQRGGTILDLPKEQQAAVMQYRQSQGGDSAPANVRSAIDPYVQDMGKLPLSQIMPTDPNQKGINTMPRAPLPPMQYAQNLYRKGQGPETAAPPPPPGPMPAGGSAGGGPTDDGIDLSAGLEDHDGIDLSAGIDNPQAPTAPAGNTLSAAPAPSWGQQAVEDLQQGGNRTFVGRTLGRMQGRGDQGYTGLESGTSPAVADYVGSPFLGAARTVAGAQEIPQHPFKGALDTAKGLLQTATLPATFMGGPVADAGIQAIPSRSAASQLFQSVMADAKDVPVTLKNSMAPLERTQQLAMRGAQPVKAADQLFQRVNTVNPMTYEEARDFASNLSRMSASEKMGMNPTMQSAVRNLSHSFNSDIADAADTVGRGQDYRSALQQYAQAMRMRDAGAWAAKKVIPAAGLGLAAEGAKKLFKK